MNKKLNTALALTLAGAMTLPLVACGGPTKLGDKEVGERVQISCLIQNEYADMVAWQNLIADYNDGVGYSEDNVYVNADLGIATAASHFTKGSKNAYSVVTVSDSISNTFVNFAYSADAKRAPDGYMLKLDDYMNADNDFKAKYAVDSTSLDWWRMTRVSNAGNTAGAPKHVIGAGQSLLAVPISTKPQITWYNEKYFKAQGINIVSIPEEDLEKYNTDNSASIMPHGYAEYKTAPAKNMTASKNLAGQTVYKVFNNCIGMNWEEMRYVLKYFSPKYNDGKVTGNASPTQYGYVSEYWFNYGWSVGGDVMGFNGTSYDFTLLDTSKNYIVTKDGTEINKVAYKAGEIVRYEDRVNQKNIADMDGVYAIESQYNAIKEYVSLQVDPGTVVDTRDGVTYKGYGVANPSTSAGDTMFNNGELAIAKGDNTDPVKLGNPDVNICVSETYREYEGGSVYYSGGDDYAHEYLKVIGESYDGKTYTGELKVVDGTPIVGSSTTCSISKALAIPACSDPEKYQAAWNFISWVATEGQKYIAGTKDIPVSRDVLLSDKFIGNTEFTKGKNFYPVAKSSLNAGRGDWGYFENGQWVTNWSDMFNKEVRTGQHTLSEFEQAKKDNAKKALDGMYCVIKGIR